MISTTDQTLLVEMEQFWALSANKISLQQKFIKWIVEKVESEHLDIQLFLGGAHEESSDVCLSYVGESFTRERLLECTHEEADDRIFFHAHHATKVAYYRSVDIASADTDILVSATYFTVL